ncbi:hypothetical protein ACFL21_02165 [Patescibacteria group bacterium]
MRISRLEDANEQLTVMEELLIEAEEAADFVFVRRELEKFLENLDDIPFFNLDVQRRINAILWQNRKNLGVDSIARMIGETGIVEEEDVFEFRIGGTSVLYHSFGYNFVPPDDPEVEITPSGGGFEKQTLRPRTTLFYEVIEELGVGHCLAYEGQCSTEMFRQTPYILFIIEELDRAVLLCEEDQNRTFVKKGVDNLENLSFSGKKELKSDPNVKNFVWKGPHYWKARLRQLLLNEFDDAVTAGSNGNGGQPDESTGRRRFNIDPELYIDQESLKTGLEAFAQASGVPDVFKLTTDSEIITSCIIINGKELSFLSFIIHFGIIRGLVSSHNDGRSNLSALLSELKEAAGYQPRNLEYYETHDFVRQDFEAFALAAGFDTILELNNKHLGIRATCSNGEQDVTFGKYLSDAARFILGCEDSVSAAQNQRNARICLLISLGYDQFDYTPRDADYYNDPKNLKTDFDSFKKVIGVDCPTEIKGQNRTIFIQCNNGENVHFRNYILVAKRVLGLSMNFTDAVNHLLSLAGFEVETKKSLDKDYFENVEFVKADLLEYARARGSSTPLDLNTGGKNEEITCSSGKTLKYKTYLRTARRIFKFDGDKATLNKLLEIAGYVIRNREYYENNEYLDFDVNAIMAKAGVDSPHALKTKHLSSEFICSNGQEMKIDLYLRQAGKALGIKGERELGIFKILYKNAGNELDELSDLDPDFFKNKREVLRVLTLYSDAANLSGPNGLLTSHYRTSIEIKKGLTMTFSRFVSRAAKFLKITDATIGEQIIALKKHAGIKALDENYFLDAACLRNDLISYARAAGAESIYKLKVTGKNSKVEAGLSNGDVLNLDRYLIRAIMMLKLEDNSKKARSRINEIFEILLKTAGFERRDSEYYENPENVQFDLEQYATVLGLEDLTTFIYMKKFGSIKAVCKNGEPVELHNYLTRAALSLGLTDNYDQAKNVGPCREALERLLNQ